MTSDWRVADSWWLSPLNAILAPYIVFCWLQAVGVDLMGKYFPNLPSRRGEPGYDYWFTPKWHRPRLYKYPSILHNRNDNEGTETTKYWKPSPKWVPSFSIQNTSRCARTKQTLFRPTASGSPHGASVKAHNRSHQQPTLWPSDLSYCQAEGPPYCVHVSSFLVDNYFESISLHYLSHQGYPSL